MNTPRNMKAYRKWLGVFLLLIEMNLLGGTIYGFQAIFKVLSRNGIYRNLCPSSSSDIDPCPEQLRQYQVKTMFYRYLSVLFLF